MRHAWRGGEVKRELGRDLEMGREMMGERGND